MHYPALLKAQSLILAGDIVGAESALVALADEEGDHALVLALDQLPPKDLLAVIREYDTSKESVLNLLVTPEQFSRAVVIEKQYKDLTHAHLRGMACPKRWQVSIRSGPSRQKRGPPWAWRPGSKE